MMNWIMIIGLLFASPSNTKQGKAHIAFEQTTIKIGDVYPEERYERKFIFTNTGNAPLIINEVEKSCGCTVVDFSKEPIAPGAKGEIKVDYIPKKTSKGFFSKSFVVYSNADNEKEYIYIQGTVLEKKDSK